MSKVSRRPTRANRRVRRDHTRMIKPRDPEWTYKGKPVLPGSHHKER